ncbi:recombination regulator RecX [Cytobacillus purgationiresistens]|uniref:Regulatory protein RecX n=1 Tax=Cytobacillus purgationiresistens TaxID=863449 RepID=A0ABU0AQU1_9BACI|nr:recombination regulator RecX [Cytobacillus purgationiresistens]MDQ0273617.1 regulatory protein [Cytobacillus purgationiresistens]
MPIITKITVQKKNKDRYNIFLDDGNGGEKYAFSVDEDVFIKHQLKKGLELEDFSILDINYQDDIRKAYNMGIQFLARRMRSENEVRKHLLSKDMEEPIIREAIHRLYNYSFLNDEEFAIAFVRTQKNTTDKGSGQIKNELREKGISDRLITAALKEYPWGEELDTAIRVCGKYINKYKRESSRIVEQKLEQVLQRKGFSFDIIREAIAESDTVKAGEEEQDALRHHAEKLERKYINLPHFEYRQKMKQSLFRKGFSFDLIDQYLQDEQ